MPCPACRASAAMLLALAFAPTAFPQDPRGSVTGRVLDSSTAAVPAADVRVVNDATGVSAAGRSNDEGRFILPYLPAGEYSITVTAIGFKRFQRGGVPVRIGEATEITLTLEIGNVAETVEVTSSAPVLDTASSSLGQVMDERRIVELPTLAGNAFELALLTPGVMNGTNLRDRKPAFNNGNSQISSDGNGTYNNEVQIDGVSNTFADGQQARVAFSPPQTAIQEFKMQTATYDASIGHTIGGLLNVSTKSGTNGFHGEMHWFIRNNAFDAPNFFSNKNGTKEPVYQDNRYGFSGGGPVIIPRVYNGKNRTFFFYAWEANKWIVPQNFTGTVPTALQRRGDFSELLALGDSFQIYDPQSTVAVGNGRFQRQPFAGNIIPVNRLDAVGRNLTALYPLPNVQGTADGRNNFFNGNLRSLEDYWVNVARVDHAFSERNRMFVRIHYDFWEEDKNDHFNNRINGIILNRKNRGVAFDDVMVLSPSLLLNLRYGLTQQEFPERRVTQGFDLASLGFSPSLIGQLSDPSIATVPRVTIGGYSTLSPWESGDGTNSGLTHMAAGNFTKLAGIHNLKFGADFRVYRAFGNRFPQSISPDFAPNTTFTRGPLDNAAPAPIGQQLASLLLGVPDGQMAFAASSAMQSRYLGLFLHDDVKLTRKLTVNLGLRYERDWGFTERFDRLVADFDQTTPNPVNAQARINYARNPIPELPVGQFQALGGLTFANNGGNPRSPYGSGRNMLMPRIGIALQLSSKTVLRAGYGMYFQNLDVNVIPARQDGFSQSTPIQASLDNGLTYLATNANPFPSGLLQPLGPAGGLSTNLGQNFIFYRPDLTPAYSQRFSLGLQQQLGSFLLEATYVGNRGTRLGILRDINETPASFLSTSPVRDNATNAFLTQTFPNPFRGTDPIYGANISRANLLKPFPQFGRIQVEDSAGYNWYHSLQLRSERRFANGFTFQLAYTWSKLMEAVEFLNRVDTQPYEVLSSLDRPHRVAISGIYELPFGKGRAIGGGMPGYANFFAGGWQINAIVAIQSGQPLNFGNIIFNGDIKDVPLASGERTAEQWFNVNAGFNRVGSQQLVNNYRQFPLRFSGIRGDNQTRWDVSALKNFPLGERFQLQFRAEAFNALNQTNFNNPNTTPTAGAFGTITGTASQARTFQFALKLQF